MLNFREMLSQLAQAHVAEHLVAEQKKLIARQREILKTLYSARRSTAVPKHLLKTTERILAIYRRELRRLSRPN